MRLLDAHGLHEKGIKFSRQHRHRLIRAGRFPRPVKIGFATNAWPEVEIDSWIQERIADRDQAVAACEAQAHRRKDKAPPQNPANPNA